MVNILNIFIGGPLTSSVELTSPWDIPIMPKAMFEDETVEIELPNTASLKPCDTCSGVGSVDRGFCVLGIVSLQKSIKTC